MNLNKLENEMYLLLSSYFSNKSLKQEVNMTNAILLPLLLDQYLLRQQFAPII